MLEEFHKEAKLQYHVIESILDDTDLTDPDACRTLTREAATAASTGPLQQYRFGYFEGEYACIVFTNLGQIGLRVCREFRERYSDQVLAAAATPEVGEAEKPQDEHYTCAVLVDDAGGEIWIEKLQECYRSVVGLKDST